MGEHQQWVRLGVEADRGQHRLGLRLALEHQGPGLQLVLFNSKTGAPGAPSPVFGVGQLSCTEGRWVAAGRKGAWKDPFRTPGLWCGFHGLHSRVAGGL